MASLATSPWLPVEDCYCSETITDFNDWIPVQEELLLKGIPLKMGCLFVTIVLRHQANCKQPRMADQKVHFMVFVKYCPKANMTGNMN